MPAKFIMDYLFGRANIGLAIGGVDRDADHGARDSRAVLYARSRAPRERRCDEHARPLESGNARAAPGSRGRTARFTAGALRASTLSLLIAALFFLLPLYVMLVTSVKPMAEIRLGNLLALPAQLRRSTRGSRRGSPRAPGLTANGITGRLLELGAHRRAEHGAVDPVGALNGYALSFWRPRGAELLFGVLLMARSSRIR